jgi:hypothetical protein
MYGSIFNYCLNAQPTTPTTPVLSSVTQPTCDNPYGMVQVVNYNNGWNYSFTPSVGVTMNALGAITALPGIYTLNVNNGVCTSSSVTFTINQNPSTPATPTIGSITQPTCTQALGTFTITNYNPTFTYNFTPSTGVVINTLGVVTAPAGSYLFTVTNTQGCISLPTAVVINSQPITPATPLLSSVVQPTCDNQLGYFNITNYNNAYNYIVTPSQNVIIDALGHVMAPAGSYTIVANNGTCLSAVANITVNAQPITPVAPIITTIIQPTCTQAMGSFTIANYNGANTYTFTPNVGVVMTSPGNFNAPAGLYSIYTTSTLRMPIRFDKCCDQCSTSNPSNPNAKCNCSTYL